MRVHTFSTLLFALALTAGARAADTSAAYAGSTASADNAGRVAQALALVQPAVSLAATPLHLDELAPAGALLAPGADGIACDGEPVDRAAYRAQVARLNEAVWEVEDLQPLFDSARRTQACLSETVDAADLARVDFVQGVMAFELGDPESATAAFREVFAKAPSFAWDGQFGPGAKASFDAVSAETASGPRVELTILAGEGDLVMVDGVSYETATLLVSPGRHLVQLGRETALRSVLVDTADRAATVVLDAAVSLAELEAGTPGAAVTALFAGLGDAAPEYLVWVGEDKRAWRWAAETGTFDEVALPRAAVAALEPAVDGGKKRPGPATPVLIAVGAGLVAGGTVLAAATRSDIDAFSADVEAGILFPFPSPNAENPEDYELYGEWQGKVNRLGVGYALIAVGGVSLLASIPVGLLTARPASPEVAFNATILSSGQSDGADGIVFTVSWK